MKNKAEILFQNKTLLALNKPSGILSVPDRYNADRPSIASLITETFPEARPLHRLDLETSGVLLFCLSTDAFGWYSDQFEARSVHKKYLALGDGRCVTESGEIDAPLYTTGTGKVTIHKRGKSSQTQWRVLEHFKHHTLFELTPLTGRTHQIRVHLASIGHPVLGDTTYGSAGPLYLSDLKGKGKYKLGRDKEQEYPIIQRIALHAASITITDYSSSEPIEVQAPLPKDMRVGLNKLRQFAAVAK